MAKQTDLLPIGLIAIAVVVGIPLFKLTGIIPGRNEGNANAVVGANYFDPKWYKTGGSGTYLLNSASATLLAKNIYDSKGYFNDDEDKLFGVFKSLKTKSQVSYLAEFFYKKYSKDLVAYLQTFLNDDEMARLKKIIDPLPNYKPRA